MKSIVEEKIQQLEAVSWFHNVGIKDTGYAIVLDSWQHALDTLKSTHWEDITLEAANHIRDKVIKRSKARYNLWNEVVSEIKPIIIPLVEKKTEPLTKAFKLDATFKAAVLWDMIHLAVELEYSDLCGFGFFNSESYWYINGHFPCGWEGEYPKGRIIVY